MFRNILSIGLATLLLQTDIFIKPASANSRTDEEAKFVQKVKQGIFKLGVGQEAKVKLTLRDRTKLAGYVSGAEEDSFVITDSKTGLPTTVAYTDVVQLQGQNPKGSAHTGWFIAIAVAILVIFVVVAAKSR